MVLHASNSSSIGLLRQAAALAYRVGKRIQHDYGVFPADASVGDAYPTGERFAGDQVLTALNQI